MTGRSLVFAAALSFCASAWAFHCPQDMKKIDDALAKNPKLTAAQMEFSQRIVDPAIARVAPQAFAPIWLR